MSNAGDDLGRAGASIGTAVTATALAADRPAAPPPQPPLAATVSEQARAQIAPLLAAAEQPRPEMTLAQMRAFTDAIGAPIVAARKVRYQVTSDRRVMGGVPIEWVVANGATADPQGPLLINFHGGGFTVDSGSLAENVPLARLTGLPIAAVLYRLAPENPFPAAVDDALAVYCEALKTRKPAQIAIYGTSAGAILTVQLLARIKAEGLPMPAAAGIFSGAGDLARPGDSEGYLPPLLPGKTAPQVLADYIGRADPRDPKVSPLFGDLTGWPPVLLMTSTRDQLLSQTVMLHLALKTAGVPAELEVFEGMPHAFWSYLDVPEADAALVAQAGFLKKHLVR